MKFTLLIFLLFSITAVAEEHIVNVDISDCTDKPCFELIKKEYDYSPGIKVIAHADMTDVGHPGIVTFYPLFNIYNNGDKKVSFNIGMHLLDEDRKILIGVVYGTEFLPNKSQSDREAYRSLNAFKLTKEQIKNTRYISIIVEKCTNDCLPYSGIDYSQSPEK
ncbi:hypothetical protein [Motilimonas sp. KMU-193]|uniref:hypothetical protein n=1 Tax=Motilimonas sp. KMU-193 TaxID=3388668 RepID=UPI00396B315A